MESTIRASLWFVHARPRPSCTVPSFFCNLDRFSVFFLVFFVFLSSLFFHGGGRCLPRRSTSGISPFSRGRDGHRKGTVRWTEQESDGGWSAWTRTRMDRSAWGGERRAKAIETKDPSKHGLSVTFAPACGEVGGEKDASFHPSPSSLFPLGLDRIALRSISNVALPPPHPRSSSSFHSSSPSLFPRLCSISLRLHHAHLDGAPLPHRARARQRLTERPVDRNRSWDPTRRMARVRESERERLPVSVRPGVCVRVTERVCV